MSKSAKRSEMSRALRWRSPKSKAASKRFKESPRGRRLTSEARGKWAARIRALLTKLKSVPCADCGGTFDPVCMDFDHREPGNKLAAVSSLVGRHSEQAVLAEVAKCDVVCANCHRLRTYRRRDHEAWRNEKRSVEPQPERQLGLPNLDAELECRVAEQLP